MSLAYYNEIEAYPAQWLRNLIDNDLIEKGDVDERDIKEVKPKDLEGYKQAHFFGGIGVWSYALRQAGWSDKEVWTGSCPCQPFSSAGKRKGTSDPRHLWPAWFKLIKACKPSVVFGEQVASKDGLAWLDIVYTDLEKARYTVEAFDMCVAGFGAPHKRQRLFFVAKSTSNGRKPRGSECKGQQRVASSINASESDNLANPRSYEPRTTQGQRDKEQSDSEQDNRNSFRNNSRNRCDTGKLADTKYTKGTRQRTNSRKSLSHEESERPRPNCKSNIMGNTKSKRPRPIFEQRDKIKNRKRGPTNGYWADAEWIYCRDNKYRAIEPIYVKMVNGNPYILGDVCTNQGTNEGETVDATEYKVGPREILQELQCQNAKEKDKQKIGRFNSIQKENILRQEMYGGMDGGEDKKSHTAQRAQAIAQTTQREMRELQPPRQGYTFICPSQGCECSEQFARKFADFMRFLPSSYAFAKLRGDTASEKILYPLLQAYGEKGIMQYPSDPLEEVWKSLCQKSKDRLCLGFKRSGLTRSYIPPLSSGEQNRVGRLRAYGNAIVAPVAIEFIKAFMDWEESNGL